MKALLPVSNQVSRSTGYHACAVCIFRLEQGITPESTIQTLDYLPRTQALRQRQLEGRRRAPSSLEPQ
jgi:hypothetical protein